VGKRDAPGYEEPLSSQTANINNTIITQDNTLKVTNKEIQENDNLLSKGIIKN